MALVDEGKVSTVIVADMSRLGRDYLKVGYYTEVVLPGADVRFIAINNGVDSANQQDSDFTRFSTSLTNGTPRTPVRRFVRCSRQRVNPANRCVPTLRMATSKTRMISITDSG